MGKDPRYQDKFLADAAWRFASRREMADIGDRPGSIDAFLRAVVEYGSSLLLPRPTTPADIHTIIARAKDAGRQHLGGVGPYIDKYLPKPHLPYLLHPR